MTADRRQFGWRTVLLGRNDPDSDWYDASGLDCVVSLLPDYDLRRHMEWEESDLFPRADSLARDVETATIDVSQHMGDDPVFGATTASSFSNLLANLQRAQ